MADFNSYLPGVAGATAAAIALPLILRTVRPTAVEVEGKQILEYGRPMKMLAAVFWVCWIGLFVAALFAPAKDRVIAAGLVLGFLLLILLWHLEIFRVRLAFDADGIRTSSPWRSKRQIPWSAVERGWFSHSMQWYVLETTGFGRVRLHIYLSGVESLLAELESRGVPVVRRPDV